MSMLSPKRYRVLSILSPKIYQVPGIVHAVTKNVPDIVHAVAKMYRVLSMLSPKMLPSIVYAVAKNVSVNSHGAVKQCADNLRQIDRRSCMLLSEPPSMCICVYFSWLLPRLLFFCDLLAERRDVGDVVLPPGGYMPLCIVRMCNGQLLCPT